MDLGKDINELIDILEEQADLLCEDNNLFTEKERYIVRSAILIGAFWGIDWEANEALKRIEKVYSPSTKAIAKLIKGKQNGKRRKR